MPPPHKSLATAQVRPTAQEIAAERQILIHYEKQYQELEQEYGAAVKKTSSAFAEAKVSLDAMPTATAEAKQKVEEMKNANTAMARKYGRHFGYLKFRIDAMQQRLKEMEAWQVPGGEPASQPKEMEVRQVPGGEPARQPILTLDSAKKGVVGYWRRHVTEEEARREKLELINRDQLIVGKVTSTLSEGEKQKLLESAVRSELKQARKEEQRGLLRVDADGTLYMIFASAEDAAKDRKQRVTKARWIMTQEGGVVLFNVTGSDMFPAKSWLRSIGPHTMVLVEPAGKPGESHRSATHLREMNPAEWAKDIADLAPAAPSSK